MKIYQRLLANLQIDRRGARTAKAVADGAPPLPPRAGAPPPVRTVADCADPAGRLLTIRAHGGDRRKAARVRHRAAGRCADGECEYGAAGSDRGAGGELFGSQATSLVARRKQAYYRQVSDFTGQLFGATLTEPAAIDVKSEWFLVASRVRLDRAALDAEALVNRELNGQTFRTTTVWVRQN